MELLLNRQFRADNVEDLTPRQYPRISRVTTPRPIKQLLPPIPPVDLHANLSRDYSRGAILVRHDCRWRLSLQWFFDGGIFRAELPLSPRGFATFW